MQFSRFRQKPPQWLTFSFVLAFSLIGVLLVMSSRGVLVTKWMNIYDLSDFPNLGSLLQFLRGLRVPIPPILSAVEIANYLLTKDSYFVVNVLYRAALVLSFVVAIWLSSSNIYRLVGSFVLSVVFLWSTVVVHPGNPQTYDVFFPFFVLLYILLLKRALDAKTNRNVYLLVVTSGIFLAMAELSRPFVFFMLPVVLLCTYLALRRFPRKVFYLFLIPVVLLSGGWHLHLAVQHKQVTWTNHSGFNLMRAWPMVAKPSLAPEKNSAPLKPGRWPNINTAEHHENSKRIRNEILRYMVTHPIGAARHVLGRAKSFVFDVQTDIERHHPKHKIFGLYKPLVRLSMIWLLVGMVTLGVRLIRTRGHQLALLGAPEHILIIITVMTIGFLSMGEGEEEQARLLISVLPFLAALPIVRRSVVPSPDADAESEADGESWEVLVDGRGRRVLVASVFVVGMLFFAAYSGRVGPYIGFDLKNYHYYTGYALLEGRFDVDYAPAQIQTFLNPLSFVPFYLLASNLSPIASGVVMGGIQGMAVGLVFVIALLVFSSFGAKRRLLLSLLCAFAGAYAPMFLSTVGSSHNDVLVSLFVLAGIYMLIKGIVSHGILGASGARSSLIIGGILLGVATGLKLACAIYALACVVAVVVMGRGRRSRLVAAGVCSAAAFLGLLLSRGFWMAMLWSKFGSPLFPFYNKIFKSPYYYDRNFADVRALPESLGMALQQPFHLLADTRFATVSGHVRDARLAVVYVLLLIYIVFQLVRWVRSARRSPGHPITSEATGEASVLDINTKRAGYFLVVFFVAAYVVWQAIFSIIRYTVPLELLAPIVAIVLIGLIWRGSRSRRFVTIVAFVAITLIMKPGSSTRGPWRSMYFNLDPPRFENPEKTLVVMANNRPWSYVIPFFQPEVRFIGLYSNFSNRLEADRRHRATEEMLELIRSHQGPIYLLSFGGHLEIALKNLEPHGITITSRECLRVAEDPKSATELEFRRRRAAAKGRKVSLKPVPEPLCIYLLTVDR